MRFGAKLVLVLSTLTVFFPINLWAKCNGIVLDLTQSSFDLGLNSQPSISMKVTAGNNGNCDFFVGMSYGSGGSWSKRRISQGSYSLPMNIYLDASFSRTLKDVPEAVNSDDVFVGNFSGGNGNGNNGNGNGNGNGSNGSQTLTAYVGFPTPPVYSRFGTYTENFGVELYSGQLGGNYSLDLTRNLSFTYTVPRRVDLSLVSSGSPFDLSSTSQVVDFGNLSEGETRSLDIVAQYNAGYRLYFSSRNNGALKHLTAQNVVPYSVAVGGAPLSLSGTASAPVQVSSGTGLSPSGGSRLPVLLTVGSTAGAIGGKYSDVVTVTIQSNE